MKKLVLVVMICLAGCTTNADKLEQQALEQRVFELESAVSELKIQVCQLNEAKYEADFNSAGTDPAAAAEATVNAANNAALAPCDDL